MKCIIAILCLLTVGSMDNTQIEELKSYREKRDRQLVDDIATEMQHDYVSRADYVADTDALRREADMYRKFYEEERRKRYPAFQRSGTYTLNDSMRAVVRIDTLKGGQ